ncbi:MAG: RdgB/HAM1 family non-canonical purine NTP pyrophosphatase [Oscillospiraceae bacterium]
MKLILASNNKDKLREIREILSGTGLEVISQREAGCSFEAEENGKTFRENARIKARAAMEATGIAALADDSGLEVNAMDGGPGIYSARYGGVELSYDKKCQMILDEVAAGDGDRGARFKCSVVCVFPNGDEICADGVIEGNIGAAPEGNGGFGYDPIFVPEGFACSMACLTDDEKNAISHRGSAFRDFAEKLNKYMAEHEIKE